MAQVTGQDASAESVAEVLRAAAARLRELASRTNGGSWKARIDREGGYEMPRVIIAALGGRDGSGIAVTDDRADAEYIALVDPEFGEAVAGWLEDAASRYDDLDESPYPGAAAFVAGDSGGDPDPALKVARAVLAGDRP